MSGDSRKIKKEWVFTTRELWRQSNFREGMCWLWSACMTVRRRRWVGSRNVSLDAVEVQGGERETPGRC